jgi:hypothetical protein
MTELPDQIHTDEGKEFVYKQSQELFIHQPRYMTLAHPQCNPQVEVFNKIVKKFLCSLIDDSTLN